MNDIPEVHKAHEYEPGVFFDAETGGPLELELRRIGPKRFRVRKQFGYRDLDPEYKEPFICPHDVGEFETDLASIPWFFSWIVPMRGKHFPAIMLHDALVTGEEDPLADDAKREHLGPAVDREEADRIMRDAMERLGVGFVRRWLAWTGAFLATAFTTLKPRVWWRTLTIVHFALIGLLGVLATIDLFDVKSILPWMGDRGTLTEIALGFIAGLLIPPVLSAAWGPKRWKAAAIGGIVLAFVLHITAAMFVLYQLYRLGELLFSSRTRPDDVVAADEKLVALDDTPTAQFGKGSATFVDVKVARPSLTMSVIGPKMLVDRLRLVTDLGLLEGHNKSALDELAQRLTVTIHCGKGAPIDAAIKVEVERQGPVLEIHLEPMSMYESTVEIRVNPDEQDKVVTLESLLNSTIAANTGRGYLAGLVPLAPSGHMEAHGHHKAETGDHDMHGMSVVDEATGEELFRGHP